MNAGNKGLSAFKEVMGIDGMRVGGGRCPPLLVAGLLVVCLMLICNWWTLSSENLELLGQIDDLNEQLKMSAEERDQCVTLRGNLEQRYKHLEEEVATLRIRLEQNSDLKKQYDELKDSNTACKTERDSLNKLDATKTATLETLRLEKDAIIAQLDTMRDENKKQQEELTKVKEELDRLKLTPRSPLESRAINIPPSQTDTLIDNNTKNQDQAETQEDERERLSRPDANDGANEVAEDTDDNNEDQIDVEQTVRKERGTLVSP